MRVPCVPRFSRVEPSGPADKNNPVTCTCILSRDFGRDRSLPAENHCYKGMASITVSFREGAWYSRDTTKGGEKEDGL